MKISILLVIFIILVSTEGQQSHRLKREIDLLGIFKDKTSQLVNYVKDTGRSLKSFYSNNVKNILPWSNNKENEDIDDILDKEASLKDKFKHYIDTAKSMANTVYDSIAPDALKSNCSDKAIVNTMTTTQLAALYGYASESHAILTDDGYILTVHRIPYPKNAPKNISSRKTVLMHHGLLGSSADWVIPGPEKGLAYILSDAGYDVWMANVRGNTYSRAHMTRDVNSFAFWNFTFHDVSQYDLPAVINYIVKKKGKNVKIDYVGFSMGTTVLFALLSTKTEYNKVLRAGFALAPVAYMANIKSPIKVVAKFSNNIDYMMKLFGSNEFLPRNAVIRYLTKHSCKFRPVEDSICEISMFIFCGHDKMHFDRSLIPLIYGHVPAGASTKTLTHYAQEIKNQGRFQQFDFGPELNMKQYGSIEPPEYSVHKITLPIALISGKDDWLSSVSDASSLYRRLPNPIEHYIVPMKDFNHLDFLFAKDADILVYDKLLQLMGN